MNNNVTIGITGATGHIGSQLNKYLRSKGFRVVAFVRNVDAVENTIARPYDLTHDITGDLFRDIDVLVHCAYVSLQENPNAEQLNFNGSKLLFQACRQQGVDKIIFFSSVTADANAQSGYAKSKFLAGQLLDSDQDFLIRCSMVIGTGGLFHRLLDYGTTHTFIPVIGSGNQVIQLIAIDDVVCFVEKIITEDLRGTGVLASNEEVTYKELFSLIAEVFHTRIFFVSVPAVLLKIILRACKLLRIRTGASDENIQGMQTLRRHEPLLLFTTFRSLKEKLIELRDTSPPSERKNSANNANQ